jgi:hypothetical protein
MVDNDARKVKGALARACRHAHACHVSWCLARPSFSHGCDQPPTWSQKPFHTVAAAA